MHPLTHNESSMRDYAFTHVILIVRRARPSQYLFVAHLESFRRSISDSPLQPFSSNILLSLGKLQARIYFTMQIIYISILFRDQVTRTFMRPCIKKILQQYHKNLLKILDINNQFISNKSLLSLTGKKTNKWEIAQRKEAVL